MSRLVAVTVLIAFGLARVSGAEKAAGSSKPWGELEIRRIPLEDSEHAFPDRAERLKKPAWHFENMSPAQVLGFFETCHLSPGVRAELWKTNEWTVQSNGCVVFPSDELRQKLTHLERQKIFTLLGRSDANYTQRWPFRIPIAGFDERFAGSGLAPGKLDLIRSLTYTNGNQLCFCSLATLQKRLTPKEFASAVDALYAVPAVQVRLHVTPDSDVNGLVDYWGQGGRAKRIRPLVESLAKVSGGGSVNISFMLPSFARFRLYVFPDPERDVIEAKTDCFYTALNFFNEKPDAKFLDHNVSKETLQTDYRILRGEKPAFGDVVTFINQQGNAFHVAVYIAQDIVFTKNGENYLQPWVLMRMDDVMAFYGAEEPIRIMIFRRKTA